MRSMLKIMLLLAVGFASTFLLLNATGVLSVEKIQIWLDRASSISPLIIALTVAFLLFSDLFVAMPTLTIMLLAGYFLGPVAGAIASIAGLTLAGFCGYFLSHRYGDRLLRIVVKKPQQREDAIASFRSHGVTTILLSRAVPILPEVSACMAGLTAMPLYGFALAWLASTVSYAIIATYAGSISTVSDPTLAVLTAVGLTGALWGAWFIFRYKNIAANNSVSGCGA